MAPSVRTIAAAFPQLEPKQVRQIRNAMVDHRPKDAMEIIDGILGTHGVEYIPQGRNRKSPAITYCNTGDSYGTTVLYIDGNYSSGAWGDRVERGSYT